MKACAEASPDPAILQWVVGKLSRAENMDLAVKDPGDWLGAAPTSPTPLSATDSPTRAGGHATCRRPHDPRRIGGVCVDDQGAITRDRPEPVALMGQVGAVRAESGIAADPVRRLTLRLVEAFCSARVGAGDAATGSRKLPARAASGLRARSTFCLVCLVDDAGRYDA